MAENLARIFGTEEDKVNCPFYFKIGACRHGDRCSRQHNRPHFSQTLLIPHMYTLPPINPLTGQPMEDEREHLRDFCEEVIDELATFGRLDEFHVVGNLGEHMLGNVYLKYSSEEEAEKALKSLNGRFYAGRQLTCEYSPVTDFRESRCRQYDEETCTRGGFCNFMHMRPLPSSVKRDLEKLRDKANRRRRRSRSRSPRGGGGSDRRERSSRDERSDRSRGGDRREEKTSSRERRGSRDRGERSSRDERTNHAAPSSSSSSSHRDGPASAAPADTNGSSHGNGSTRPERSESEERRAKFAEMNARRDAARKATEAALTASSGGGTSSGNGAPPTM